MIIGFFGNLGGGKTISAIPFLKDLERGGYVIFSNITLSFPYLNIMIDDIIDVVEGRKTLPPKSAIFIDEVTLWLESRGSGTSKVNKKLTHFLLQTRKLGQDTNIGLYFFYTTQFPRLIDVRLWLITNIKVICEKEFFEEYTLINQTWVIEKMTETVIDYNTIIANKYYSLYNTKEIVREQVSRYDK